MFPLSNPPSLHTVPKAKRSRRMIESDEEEEDVSISATGKKGKLDTSLEKRRAEGKEEEEQAALGDESVLETSKLDDSRLDESLNSSHVVCIIVASMNHCLVLKLAYMYSGGSFDHSCSSLDSMVNHCH